MLGKDRIVSGIPDLDRLLGAILIGDNVVWYDDAGSLAPLFCLRFMEKFLQEARPVIYVSFDRSPRNLLERLGAIARHPLFILIDCFTFGKGRGSSPFLSFYDQEAKNWQCRILCLDRPADVDLFMEALYKLHGELQGVVGFVFESLTGMQDLWGGEENMARFYTHACPRLYELNTVAYWIMEKKAHSPRLRAQINQIAQVVIELAVKRGTTTLTVLKAEGRAVPTLGDPLVYWADGPQVVFGQDVRGSDRVGIGRRLRHWRTERGLSQTELARLVGVTPSSISQVESNLIYPSVPALLKMAEVLQVPVASFFAEEGSAEGLPLFPEAEAVVVKTIGAVGPSIRIKVFAPWDLEAKAQPYLIEFDPGSFAGTHFFKNKNHELGCVLSGAVDSRLGSKTFAARKGDMIYLAREIPVEWRNNAPEIARLFGSSFGDFTGTFTGPRRAVFSSPASAFNGLHCIRGLSEKNAVDGPLWGIKSVAISADLQDRHRHAFSLPVRRKKIFLLSFRQLTVSIRTIPADLVVAVTTVRPRWIGHRLPSASSSLQGRHRPMRIPRSATCAHQMSRFFQPPKPVAQPPV